MTITRELLDTKQKELQTQRTQLLANVNAVEGALLLIEHLLKAESEPEPEKKD